MLKGKRQVVYVMLITAIFFYSCEKEVNSDMLVERNGLQYEVNSEKPFSGRSVEFFEGGEVKSKSTSYKDGKLDGVFRTWFENGQISSEDSYKDGSVTLSKLWYENGHQLAETSWKADKANGIVKFWYENGQLKSEESYIDDENQGLKKVWYKNGQQQFEGVLKDGQPNGKIHEWHENGQQQFEGVFKDGQLAGKSQRWYDNGTLEIEAIFLEGKKDGLWTFWNRNGEKAKELEYENGLLTNTILFQAVADYDGNVYETIKVGDQVWMAENLKVTHFRNGDPIPNPRSYMKWNKTKSGAFCIYNSNEKNGSTYGALYNWYAIEDRRKIAPEGWHVPTDDEWKKLEIFLGMSQLEADKSGFRGTNEGSKLAGKSNLWEEWSPGIRSNSEFGASGFTALPSGERGEFGTDYAYMSNMAYFWTNTAYNKSSAWCRTLYDDVSKVERIHSGKMNGYSIRCIKD